MYSLRLSHPISSINCFRQCATDQGHAIRAGPELHWKLRCYRPETGNFWTRGLAGSVCSGPRKVYSPPCWWPSHCQNEWAFPPLTYQQYLLRSMAPCFVIHFCFLRLPRYLTLIFLLPHGWLPPQFLSLVSPHCPDFKYWVYFHLCSLPKLSQPVLWF